MSERRSSNVWERLLLKFLKHPIREFKRNMGISHAGDISRRYFVMNAYDGVMTMLGIIVGTQVSGAIHPRFVVGAGVGASIAMGISGFIGAYMTEGAIRAKKLKELESQLFTDLEHSVLAEASKFATLWVAFVDGVSPALGALVSMAPFLLALWGMIPLGWAVPSSIILSLLTLFLLGSYLGKISRENIILYGLRMALAGIFTVILFTILGVA